MLFSIEECDLLLVPWTQALLLLHFSHPSEASLPHPTFPDTCMLMPNWTCWRVWMGGLIQALFCMHSSYPSEASLPHPTFPDFCMLMPNWTCWRVCLGGLIQVSF